MKRRRLDDAAQSALELTITALGRDGEGLAEGAGQRIYVPGALPGERIRATLTEQIDRDVLAARLDQVLSASPDRVQPQCPHVGACGGCALQHLALPAYRAWKEAAIRDQLARGKVPPLEWDAPVFVGEATRRRASFAVARRGGRMLAGFHSPRSHRVADIASCLVVRPKVFAALESARPWLGRLVRDGEAAALLVQEVGGAIEAVLSGPLDERVQSASWAEAFAGWARAAQLSRIAWRLRERDEPETMIAPGGPIVARFGALKVPLPPGAFLQPSREGELAIGEAVLTFLDAAGHGSGTAIADLFAGCGTFSGPLLERGPVLAVELAANAIAALKAAKAGPALSLEQRNLFTRPLLAPELQRFQTVVLDPPRAGAAAQAAALAVSGVRRVVYVSCNPSALAKDAAILMQGGFAFRRARLIDQFIWSAHGEVVALFTR